MCREYGACGACGVVTGHPNALPSAHMRAATAGRWRARQRVSWAALVALAAVTLTVTSLAYPATAESAADGVRDGSSGSGGSGASGSGNGVYRTSAPVRKPRPEPVYDPFAQGGTAEDIIFSGEAVPGEVQSQVRLPAACAPPSIVVTVRAVVAALPVPAGPGAQLGHGAGVELVLVAHHRAAQAQRQAAGECALTANRGCRDGEWQALTRGSCVLQIVAPTFFQHIEVVEHDGHKGFGASRVCAG